MQQEELTYDALRRVERQENTSPRLSRLEPGLWQRLGEHLNRLRQEFQAQQEEDPTARRTVVLADELRNTQRLAQGIWSLREKKVVQAALGAVRRSEGKTSQPENATPEERDLFVSVMEVLAGARDAAAITDPFAKGRVDRASARREAERAGATEAGAGPSGTPAGVVAPDPVAAPQAGGDVAAAQAQEAPMVSGGRTRKAAGKKREEGGDYEAGRIRAEGLGPGGEERGGGAAAAEEGPEEAQAQADEGRGGVGAPGEAEMELRLVQALKQVPLFAGPDLATYELGAGEVGTLPSKAAKILEQRGLVRILPGP